MARTLKTISTLLILLISTTSLVHTIPLPCNEITHLVTPCMPYLSGRAVMPYRMCCAGINVLNRTTVTHNDRMTICNCLKFVASRFSTVDFSRAALLPRLCGIAVNVTITPNMDCATVPQF
ncbi:hypothetical protein LUZ60_010096 [Juncus effusus]|nr:hypothetical protein LUZ60_010096 [Juncus effusus]